MWFRFLFQEVCWWDEPNIQICYDWTCEWQSVSIIESNILELSENIAKNIMLIITSEQIFVKYDIEDWLFFEWKFSDCHSFAYFFSSWSPCNFRWPLIYHKDKLEKIWFEKIFNYNIWDQLPTNLMQWDIFTTVMEWSDLWIHSLVYLWNLLWEDYFIECSSNIWYVNDLWEYYRNIDWKDILYTKNSKKYLREWYRAWWKLKIWTIDKMFWYSKYCWRKKTVVYRKNNTNSFSSD